MTHITSMSFPDFQVSRGRGIFALVLLTALVYANVLGGAFIWDDEYLYLDNPNLLKETVKTAFIGGNPFAYLQGSQAYKVYRPIQVLAHTWLARLFHLDPFGIHLASVVFHAAAGVLVFLLVLEFASLPVAWVTAALFLVHPLHVEAVAWMAAFSEVLAGCLMLLSLYLMLRAERARQSQVPGPNSPVENPGTWDLGPGTLLGISYLAAALAFLTKETALGLPLLALFFAGWRAWPYFVIAGGTLLMRFAAMGTTSAALTPRPLWRQINLVATAALQYAKKIVWPWPIAPEYNFDHSLIAWALFGAACSAVLWLASRKARLRVGLLLGIVPLAPALAASIFFPAHRLAQDRYAYLAVLGFCLLIGYAAKRRAGLVACLALLALWSGLSVAATFHWRDSESLWSHTLRITPDSKTAVLGLGYWYFSTKQFAEAQRLYERGLLLRPNDPDLLTSLAAVKKAVKSEK